VSDTPETDAYIGDQNEGLMTEGEFAMCEFARMIERDRNELRHKFETLERENAAMRKAIKEAQLIQDWADTDTAVRETCRKAGLDVAKLRDAATKP
jgi:hypothetical protein